MPIKTDIRTLAFCTLFPLAAALTFSISIFEISTAVFFGLMLVLFWKEPHALLARLKKPLMFFLVLYFVLNLLSLTQTQYWEASGRGIGKVGKGILLCLFTFVVMDDEAKHKKIFEWILWVSLLINLDALIQGFTGREWILGRQMTKYYEDVGRVTATFVHANDYSAFLSVMLFFYLGALLSGKSAYPLWKRWVWAVGFVITFVCLLWTYSRGAWLAVILSFALSLVFRRNKKFLVFLAVLLVAGIVFAPPALKQRLGTIKNILKSGTVVERKVLWSESLRMIQKSPVLGLGVNTYAKNEPNYKLEGATDYQYAHNGYLQIAAEIGLLGLAGFLAIIFYFLFCVVPRLATTAGDFGGGAGFAYAFGTLAFLIHSTVDTNLQSARLINLLWFLWGLAFSFNERHS